jgi:amino acid transporter
MLASSRTYYAMAKEGLFFRKAAQLNAASVPCYLAIVPMYLGLRIGFVG